MSAHMPPHMPAHMSMNRHLFKRAADVQLLVRRIPRQCPYRSHRAVVARQDHTAGLPATVYRRGGVPGVNIAIETSKVAAFPNPLGW